MSASSCSMRTAMSAVLVLVLAWHGVVTGAMDHIESCRITLLRGQQKETAFLHNLTLILEPTPLLPAHDAFVWEGAQLCTLLLEPEPRLYHNLVHWSLCQDLAPFLSSPSPSFPLRLPLTIDPSTCASLHARRVGGSPKLNSSSTSNLNFNFNSGKSEPLALLLRAFVLPGTRLSEPFWVPLQNSLVPGSFDVRNPPPYHYVPLREFPKTSAELETAAREAYELRKGGVGSAPHERLQFCYVYVRAKAHEVLRSYLGHAWAAMPDLPFYMGDTSDAPVAPVLSEEVDAVLEAVTTDAEVRASLRHVAGPESEVVVVTFNSGHAELGLNLLTSLQQLGMLHKVVLFALDEEAALIVQQSGMQLGLVISLYNAAPRRMATLYSTQAQFGEGLFGVVTMAKLLSVLCVLRMGHSVLLLDADVVALQDPLAALRQGAGLPPSWRQGANGSCDASGAEVADEPDVIFQSGGYDATHDRWALESATGLSSTFPLLNTGVMYIRPTPASQALFTAALAKQDTVLRSLVRSDVPGVEQRDFGFHSGSYMDDQVAVNSIVFQRHMLLGLQHLKIGVCDPRVWATPATYQAYLRGEARGVRPVLAHIWGFGKARNKRGVMDEMGLWWL